ncbi:unnamed protein product, partial [Rotaria magnacalcarata]
IINRYRPPIKTSNAEDIAIAEKMILLRNQKNNFEKFLQRNNLKESSTKWHAMDRIDIIEEFPILSEDEIVNDITLGTFQLKRARSYAEENASTTDLTGSVNYTIHRCQEFPDIIRVPTQSAHVSRAQYHPTIRFTREEILDWWRDCTAGNSVIGCCSHIASAICFLSFERWQTQSRSRPSGTFINFVADAAAQQELSDSTNDDEDEDDDED